MLLSPRDRRAKPTLQSMRDRIVFRSADSLSARVQWRCLNNDITNRVRLAATQLLRRRIVRASASQQENGPASRPVGRTFRHAGAHLSKKGYALVTAAVKANLL